MQLHAALHLTHLFAKPCQAQLVLDGDDEARLLERVIALHSYDCPCVAVVPVEGGNPAFLDWIATETEPDI